MTDLPALRSFPRHLKVLARWILVVLAVGYAHGLLFVAHTTHLTPAGTSERYRGNQMEIAEGQETSELKFEKSYSEMLNIIHTHLVGMAGLFAISSIAFSFCSTVRRPWKTILLVEPWIALLTSFGGMWLMRYVHPDFGWLLYLSSASMAAAFYVTIGFSLRELWMKDAAA